MEPSKIQSNPHVYTALNRACNLCILDTAHIILGQYPISELEVESFIRLYISSCRYEYIDLFNQYYPDAVYKALLNFSPKMVRETVHWLLERTVYGDIRHIQHRTGLLTAMMRKWSHPHDHGADILLDVGVILDDGFIVSVCVMNESFQHLDLVLQYKPHVKLDYVFCKETIDKVRKGTYIGDTINQYIMDNPDKAIGEKGEDFYD